MSSILAKVFSTADSWKRQLGDMLANPILHVERSIGQGLDSSRTFQSDLLTADSKSVLISKEEKQAAELRTINSMVDSVAGSGIIVPAGAAGKSLRELDVIKRLMEHDPATAYASTGVFKHPKTGILQQALPDSGRLISQKAVIGLPIPKKPGFKSAAIDKEQSLSSLINFDGLPSHLQDYFQAIRVAPQGKPGASFMRSKDLITLGPANNSYELTSNLLHEMQHSSQYFYDLPGGGSPEFFFKDYGKYSTARELVNNMLEQKGTTAVDATLPRISHKLLVPETLQSSRDTLLNNTESLRSIADMLELPRSKARKAYNTIAGEAEARLVQKQYNLDDYISHPHSLLDVPASSLHTDSAAIPKVDSDPVTQAIINMLLGSPKP